MFAIKFDGENLTKRKLEAIILTEGQPAEAAEPVDGERKIAGPSDLCDYSIPKLVKMHNLLAPDSPVKNFHDKARATRRVWEKLSGENAPVAPKPADPPQPPAEPGQPGDTERVTPEAPKPPKRKARPSKAAKPSRRKAVTVSTKRKAAAATRVVKRTAGLKKTITVTLTSLLKDGGGTLDQLVNKLARKFPGRKPDSLRSTVNTQLSRLGKAGLRIRKTKLDGKPIRYYT